MSEFLQPYGLQPTRVLCPWDFSGKNTGVVCHALLQGDLPNPGIEPRSPALQVDSLTSEPPGGATNTLTQALEYYSAIKKNEILPTEVMLVDLENITLSEINQRQILQNITYM